MPAAPSLAAPHAPPPVGARELLIWATDRYAGSIALATAFGPQSLVVLDLLHELGRPVPVFALDTGLLFPETYALWRRVEDRFGIAIEAVRSPLSVADHAARGGGDPWALDPHACCAERKVVPLRRRLQGLGAWITGLRRLPGSRTRDAVEPIAWDAVNGLYKVNPLAAWSREEVLAWARDRDLPTNPLLERGYASVGCVPCTGCAADGDERAGRWAGSTKTECGLHWPKDPPSPTGDAT